MRVFPFCRLLKIEPVERFGDEEDTTSFIEKMKNKNTNRKTTSDLNLVKKYFESVGEIRNMEDIPPEDLDLCLARFFLNVRKVDGSEYEPDTLKSYQSSVARYLTDKKYPKNILIDIQFKHSRDVLMAKRKDLKAKGKGNKPNKADGLTAEDIGILYSNGQLGTGSPTSLINTVWWNNTTHFGLRSRQEHIDMKWGDLQLIKSSSGDEYLQYNERNTKTRTGVSGDVRPFAPKMFEIKGSNRCPVYVYKEYAKRRPQALNNDPNSSFYLSAISNPKGDIWYSRQNMGKNKIGSIMQDMCKAAGLSGKKSNHSARRTTITTLLHDGVAPTTIMQVTGHKNVQSINQYSTASEDQQRNMSKTLANLQSEQSFNSDDDENLIRASQEVENTLSEISNFENLVKSCDIQIPQNPAIVEIPRSTSVVSPPSNTTTTTYNVVIPAPDPLLPSVIDIPTPLSLSSSSSGTSCNWFAGANISSGVVINLYQKNHGSPSFEPRRKRVRMIDSDSDE